MTELSLEKHHAYFIVGGQEIIPKLQTLLEKKLNFSVSGNPDYRFEDVETFGIEESRKLKEIHSKKALGQRKVFVVKTKFITDEAQNALLKILEDPLPHSFFFFILPSEEYISPVLLSRFMVVKDKKKERTEEVEFDPEYFLNLNLVARTKLLSKIINSKDKEAALRAVNSLEKKLREKYYPFYSKEERKNLEFLLKSKEYLYSRGASLKLILESLSLALPKTL